MHRFRTRRKVKEPHGEPFPDAEPSMARSFTSKGFGRSKKTVVEDRPKINLSAALPPSDEFRTSLIMPNLSARFSMLREQDDPTTKIGKANDDSVLFPKRASRLNLFTHNHLTDIAEVDSIRESIRPPFAQRERAHSLDTDGYESDGGSIMNRSRHGEGNNLFGGRQKLYKIAGAPPVKSTQQRNSSDADSNSGMSGKAVYESDISRSLFQKHNDKKRIENRELEGYAGTDGIDSDNPQSPTISFSKDRGTTSSTASVPRRDSTAATSVDSPSPSLRQVESTSSIVSTSALSTPVAATDRNIPFHRKLYGQTMNQPAVSQRGPENFSRPYLQSTDRNTSSLPDSHLRITQTSNQPEHYPPPLKFRPASPPASASSSGTPTFEPSLRDGKPKDLFGKPTSNYPRPLSPPVSDGEDGGTLASNVQPEDRGKATAMGLFNKPNRRYDEKQFSERQIQMHNGRETPTRLDEPPTPLSVPVSPVDTSFQESQSDAVEKSSLRNQEAEGTTIPLKDKSQIPESPPHMNSQPSTPSSAAGNTFLNIEDDVESPSAESSINPPHAAEVPPQGHPAFRPAQDFKFPSFEEKLSTRKSSDALRPISTVSAAHSSSHSRGHSRGTSRVSEFGGPSQGLGLSGLVRTHLRNDSDKSSVYPPSIPDTPRIGASPPTSYHFDPPSPGPQPATQPSDMQSTMASNAKNFLTMATLMQQQAGQEKHIQSAHANKYPVEEFEDSKSWHTEMQTKHSRGGSTETQQEREAFNHALAETRRKVQEKMKGVDEPSPRSYSPVLPSAEASPAKPATGLSAIIRSKTSRTKLNGEQSPPPSMRGMSPPLDGSNKAMKLLGLSGANPPGASSAPKNQKELWAEEEQRMLEDFARRPKPRQGPGPKPPAVRPVPHAPRGPSPPSQTVRRDITERSLQRPVTPSSANPTFRDRSSPDSAGPSQDHPVQYRDDLDKAMAVGTGAHARMHDAPKMSGVALRSGAAMDRDQQERSGSAMSGRFRSNSRPPMTSNPDGRPLHPVQTGFIPSPPSSSRPSPRSPYSANSTPPILEGSPPPMKPPPSAFMHSPPAEGRITPALRNRNRSITKHMISEPTFVSTTYNATTVDLPPEASLRNGQEKSKGSSSPSLASIPFINPSRLRGRNGTGPGTTHMLFAPLTHRGNDTKNEPSAPRSAGLPPPSRLPNGFPGEGEPPSRPSPMKSRPRLRKVSSEGGDMNSKARYQALMASPSPALPTFPVKRGPSPPMSRVQSPTMQRGQSPPMSRGQSPTMQRGQSPTLQRGPSPPIRNGPVEGGMF